MQRARSALLDRFDDDHDPVRVHCATAVATLAAADPGAFAVDVGALAGALEDDRDAVVNGAADALASIATHDPAAAATVAPGAVRRADAVPALVSALDDTAAVRECVACALDAVARRTIEPPEGVRPLVALLVERVATGSPAERRRAARGLTHVELSPAGAEAATETLLAAVTDDAVRPTVARALATLGTDDRTPVEVLLSALADGDRRAALALAGVAAFEPVLADPPPLTAHRQSVLP